MKSTDETKNIEKIISSAINHILDDMGYEILDIAIYDRISEIGVGITIDRLDGETVCIKDCTVVSKSIDEVIDEVLDERYTLEVYSPGSKRILSKPHHFIRFLGNTISIKLNDPIEDNRLRYVGKIEKADDVGIILAIEDSEKVLQISYQQIQKANIEKR